ncbi:hypothetical protein BSPWISOXPB_5129 [uncultured Gammaproteobacteria bacterium]|nr:hypothetical protein BSPWISOXPB_5129 [uncultured Gammaproteobacteria bacterium]
MKDIMYFVKVSIFSSLISSAIIPPLFVMMIELNIDVESFFINVLPFYSIVYSYYYFYNLIRFLCIF